MMERTKRRLARCRLSLFVLFFGNSTFSEKGARLPDLSRIIDNSPRALPHAALLRSSISAQVKQLIAGSDDVSGFTFKMMKSQLEAHFGTSLTGRKAELIDILSDAMP